MLPTKFGVSWPFGSGEEAKNRFLRWQPSWISGQDDYSYFDLLVTPMLPIKFQSPRCFLSSFKTISLLFQKKQKIDFQNGGHGSHLGFPIRTILAIFYLQVTPMLPTKFHVNWPFSSGEEAKTTF